MIYRIFDGLEKIAVGPELNSADEPLLQFRAGYSLTRRNACEGIFVLGSVGSGKTTLLRTIGRAYLRDGLGGLVLTVKPSQVSEFADLAEAEHRSKDLIFFAVDQGVVYNPLQDETDSSEAAALVCEIAHAVGGQGAASDNEAFWREQLSILLRNLFTLCRLAHQRHDFVLAAQLFAGRANTVAELQDPTWQASSPLAAALHIAKASTDADDKLAVEYFTRAFPTHGDRLQGSLSATVSGVLDYFCREPLKSLFTGQSTFAMDDLLDRGRVCLVGLPVLESNAGRAANALLQYCFTRVATRRARVRYSFLVSDECQETVSRHLVRQLAVIREFRVCVVFATQNLAVLDDRFGESLREAFCALLATKVFGPQIHAKTRSWIADQIGKRRVNVETENRSQSKTLASCTTTTGTSIHIHWDYSIPPSELAQLRVGETICLRGGETWRAAWHKDEPGRNGTTEIPFEL